MPLRVRVIRRVAIDLETGCWNWTGASQANGYGRLQYGGRSIYAHRASFLARHGQLPPGKDVCHSCDNRICVNPDHLFEGTRADNMEDARRKGRLIEPNRRKLVRRGEKSPLARLTEQAVLAIRAEYAAGENSAALAARHETSIDNVRRIVTRNTWSHV
jgi:hypothetical protein